MSYVLGYSQANSSQPNSVHEYRHISEVRLSAELSMIAENYILSRCFMTN